LREENYHVIGGSVFYKAKLANVGVAVDFGRISAAVEINVEPTLLSEALLWNEHETIVEHG